MAKDFTEVAFNHVQFKKELDQFRDLLNSKKILGEREIQELFKASLHLTASIGTTFGNIGFAKQVAYETVDIRLGIEVRAMRAQVVGFHGEVTRQAALDAERPVHPAGAGA